MIKFVITLTAANVCLIAGACIAISTGVSIPVYLIGKEINDEKKNKYYKDNFNETREDKRMPYDFVIRQWEREVENLEKAKSRMIQDR